MAQDRTGGATVRTAVAHTSLAAYGDLQADGKLQPQQQIVLNSIARHGAMTREEIAHFTGLRLSAVCGRVNALIDAGHLVERGTKRSPTSGKLAKCVRLPGGQGELFQ
jgi:DNA-binding MarR family transcriptional regulator